MTEREMLEWAAKAAGYDFEWYCRGANNPNGIPTVPCVNGEEWNPLNDDGDALRLAVDLKIRIGFRPQAYADTPSGIRFFGSHEGDNQYSRTRLAIVRAAAESSRSKHE